MNTSVIVAVAALIVSLLLVLYTRRQTRTTERSDAREEALELAEVRGKVITELEDRLGKVEREQEREREDHAKKIRLLEEVIEHVRAEASEAQRMLVIGFRGAMLKILGHLESSPAEVDEALDYLHEMLNSDGPSAPHRRRRAA